MSGDTKRTQGWRPVPNTPYALVVQPEADRGLKILPVWVRIPLSLPRILRASVAVARRSLKPLWLGSNPRPSAMKDAYSNLFKDHSVIMTHLKEASSLFWSDSVRCTGD